MKLALFNDTHFGVRQDSPVFLQNQLEFYSKVFLPTIKKQRIKKLIHLGDVFDKRKTINFQTLQAVKDHVFGPLQDMGCEIKMFVGNHDTYYKSTNAVNSVELLLADFDNIELIHEPRTFKMGGVEIMLCPWINPENGPEFMQEIKNSKADFLMGHFEIKGFMMHRDTIACKNGLATELFSHFEAVYSGHFHEPSSDGHIHYLGAPSEYTWNDWDCRRGFNIFDTTKRDITHVRNPNAMHHRFFLTKDFEVDGDWAYLQDKIVQVIVDDGVPMKKTEFLTKAISDAGPHQFDVIDNSSYSLEEGEASVDAVKSENTMDLVDSYVDSVDDEIALDGERLKEHFRQIYVEAEALKDEKG